MLTTVALVAVSGALVTTYRDAARRRRSFFVAGARNHHHRTDVECAARGSRPSGLSAETVSVDRLPDAAPSPAVAHAVEAASPQASKVSAPPAPTDLAGEVPCARTRCAALANHDVAGARKGLRNYERTVSEQASRRRGARTRIERLLAEGGDATKPRRSRSVSRVLR